MNERAPSDPTEADNPSLSSLSGRSILLAVTGGIAAYKAAALTSTLVKAGASVRIVMTESATRFVGRLTFQSLSGRPVITSIWDADDRPDAQHIAIAREADLMVIAPATANLIAKLAAGLCDDPVSLAATALPADRPLAIAPAMNADMWANPIVQRNLRHLAEMLPSLTIIEPDSGWQACRTEGAGRMAEPDRIAATLAEMLKS
ncbi:MAG: flavoprotein [Phycisphaeraceae bacterium]